MDTFLDAMTFTASDRFGSSSSNDQDPPPPKSSFYYLSNLFMATLCAITFVGVMVITYRATKLVWHSDKVIPFMLFFLNLSLLGKYSTIHPPTHHTLQ